MIAPAAMAAARAMAPRTHGHCLCFRAVRSSVSGLASGSVLVTGKASFWCGNVRVLAAREPGDCALAPANCSMGAIATGDEPLCSVGKGPRDGSVTGWHATTFCVICAWGFCAAPSSARRLRPGCRLSSSCSGGVVRWRAQSRGGRCPVSLQVRQSGGSVGSRVFLVDVHLLRSAGVGIVDSGALVWFHPIEERANASDAMKRKGVCLGCSEIAPPVMRQDKSSQNRASD